MNGFERLLRNILKRGKSGYGDGVSDAEAHRVAMNGTRQQCLVLTRQRHLDDKTLELLARRRFDDVRPLVVWHGSMTAELARRLARIHDPSLRDLLFQRFPEIEGATEDAAADQGVTTITYVDYTGPSVPRSLPPDGDRPPNHDPVVPFVPGDIDAPDHATVDEPDEVDSSHGAVALTEGSSEPPDDPDPLPESPDHSAAPADDAQHVPDSVERSASEEGDAGELEPGLESVDPEPAVEDGEDPAPPWSGAPTSQPIDEESESTADDWDADDLELLLDIAATIRPGSEVLTPRPSPVRRKEVVDEDDRAEVSLHRILEYVPTGREAKELAARIANKRLGSLLTWLARFREAGRSPDEIVVAWHVRTTWNELRPMSRFEYPISWATTFRLLDSMPGVPDSDAALDILERIERRWRRHDCQKHTSLSAYVDRVLQDYARSTASGGNVPIDALFQ